LVAARTLDCFMSALGVQAPAPGKLQACGIPDVVPDSASPTSDA